MEAKRPGTKFKYGGESSPTLKIGHLTGQKRKHSAFLQGNVMHSGSLINSVADLSENLTGALHSSFGRGGCDGRGFHGSWIYAMMLLSKTQ